MQKTEFEEIFDEIVARPLEAIGFQKKGTRLLSDDGLVQIAWVRGGGRLASPGTIVHLACFRHSFLRDKSETVPTAAPGEPGEYPWVFSSEELLNTNPQDWAFDPSRLMSLPYGRLDFSTLSTADVISALTDRRTAFTKYVSWARALSLKEAHEQIASHVEKFWVARLWDQDYRSFPTSSHPV
ncbi:hypothetical protein PQR62_09345 [Herbaspirillum lusitanum]|uniref:DUF4304 domain-containing protein n=1 Tax=Herbaspirillum lusitanum TaxID=213312 RepID=A0ABW9A9E4_9BURK